MEGCFSRAELGSQRVFQPAFANGPTLSKSLLQGRLSGGSIPEAMAEPTGDLSGAERILPTVKLERGSGGAPVRAHGGGKAWAHGPKGTFESGDYRAPLKALRSTLSGVAG
jgi:hypothetical protein